MKNIITHIGLRRLSSSAWVRMPRADRGTSQPRRRRAEKIQKDSIPLHECVHTSLGTHAASTRFEHIFSEPRWVKYVHMFYIYAPLSSSESRCRACHPWSPEWAPFPQEQPPNAMPGLQCVRVCVCSSAKVGFRQVCVCVCVCMHELSLLWLSCFNEGRRFMLT